ncbi:hypothetical protein [Pseudonocardia humida]|uniref:Uncharacterized protein n=1 Tax=Pseudonocardia humida TaxID=2800819 RepID=A0ABT1A3T6_9PSEU|nr:hypothetical protein [Pseudonocardia humida]MCO1657677.1 hypothetical protein [Pseudonocardia humida]
MARVVRLGAVAAGAVGALIAARRVRRAGGPGKTGPTWLGVTVLAPPDRIAAGGELPEPLRALGDAVEVRMQPAPGDRGTEVYARLRDDGQGSGTAARLTGRDRMGPLRQALREAKSLVETGEVLRTDAVETTHPGPRGRLIAALDERAQKAGRL